MSSPSFWLVLIETSGNQRHIFETNKLAENVGASEQLYRLGTSEVLAAIRTVFPDSMADLDAAAKVHNSAINRPVDEPGVEVEVWYLSSGKALLFVRSREHGRRIVQCVSRSSAVSYPGVVVRGAIEEVLEFTVAGLSKAVKRVHERIERKRSQLSPEELRFQRLPPVAECRNSGLPAAGIITEGNRAVEVSVVSAAKRGGFDGESRETWRAAIRQRMGEVIPGELLSAGTLDHLERWLDEMRYVAVVHADGNGVGKIFRDFPAFTEPATPREFIDTLRAFSRGIDDCTRAAFRDAVAQVCVTYPQFTAIDHGQRQLKVPVLPLIVGGDDVTLLTTAEFAMAFVPVFLRSLEKHVAKLTSENPGQAPRQLVADIAERATGVRRLGMTVGIAIVKPHYPFFAAYSIAEGLLSDAKREVKRRLTTKWPKVSGCDVSLPVTAFDFHVHHSAGGNAINDIRSELEFHDHDGHHCRLWGGPYVVTDDVSVATTEEARNWAAMHSVERLASWADALQKNVSPDHGDRRELPNSQMHALRSALFDGPSATEHFLELTAHRYPGLRTMLHENGSVFRSEADGIATTFITRLLDAMALAHLGVSLNVSGERNEAESAELVSHHAGAM